MKTTPEQRAEWARLVENNPRDPIAVANIAPKAIRALIADLEEAQGLRASGNMILVPADKLREMQAKLAAAEKDAGRYKYAQDHLLINQVEWSEYDGHFVTELDNFTIDAAIAAQGETK